MKINHWYICGDAEEYDIIAESITEQVVDSQISIDQLGSNCLVKEKTDVSSVYDIGAIRDGENNELTQF